MRRALLAIACLFSAAILRAAASDTTSVFYSGVLVPGSVVQLTGVNYTIGIPPIMYEDAESGVNGSSVSIAANGAKIGGWEGRGTVAPVYSQTEKFSGSQALRVIASLGSNGGDFYADVGLGGHITQAMECHDVKVVGSLPGYCGSGINIKDPWWMDGNSTTQADLGIFISGSAGCNPVSGMQLTGNDFNGTYSKSFNMNTSSGPADGTLTGWRQQCLLVDGGTDGGTVQFLQSNSTGTFNIVLSTNPNPSILSRSLSGVHTFDRIHTAYMRVDASVSGYYTDNYYVSTGTYAFSHVFLADQPRLTDAHYIAHFTINSMSDTSANVTLQQTPFAAGSTAYIIVCPQTGLLNCDTSGFAVVMGQAQGGGGSSGTAPNSQMQGGLELGGQWR